MQIATHGSFESIIRSLLVLVVLVIYVRSQFYTKYQWLAAFLQPIFTFSSCDDDLGGDSLVHGNLAGVDVANMCKPVECRSLLGRCAQTQSSLLVFLDFTCAGPGEAKAKAANGGFSPCAR